MNIPKSAILATLKLKGKLGTIAEEADYIISIFGDACTFCREDIKKLLLDAELNLDLQFTYNVIDAWAMKQKTNTPLLQMTELKNTLNLDRDYFKYTLPSNNE